MLTALLVSFGVVFVAELGDKSQLITMTYAVRHRWWVVLTGVGVAALMVHGISVTIGHFLGLTLPQRPIALAAGMVFLLFAVWTWRAGRNGSSTTPVAAPEYRFVLLAMISSYVLAELGDKTMLATVTLASDYQWAGVWIGATAGMVLADALAIVIGTALHRRLPERIRHGLASVLFGLFGLWLLLDGALGWPRTAVVAIAAVAGGAGAIALWVDARSRRCNSPGKVNRLHSASLDLAGEQRTCGSLSEDFLAHPKVPTGTLPAGTGGTTQTHRQS